MGTAGFHLKKKKIQTRLIFTSVQLINLSFCGCVVDSSVVQRYALEPKISWEFDMNNMKRKKESPSFCSTSCSSGDRNFLFVSVCGCAF